MKPISGSTTIADSTVEVAVDPSVAGLGTTAESAVLEDALDTSGETVMEEVITGAVMAGSALMAIGGALGVVMVPDLFRAALLLIVVFMSVAGFFELGSACSIRSFIRMGSGMSVWGHTRAKSR